ncbi:MAG: 1-acyl-sn-glycerol-3-phosphate acyltransferase [Chloroflexia bacterium]|nr:1-acyl-sn-glycerol-3-phosphate acyltransferase [Chloroflexia bacterium]
MKINIQPIEEEENGMLYRAMRGLARFLFWIFAEIEVEGQENVPEKGPALLVCNHVNLIDPIVPIGVLQRRTSFMAKEEVFDVPLFGRLLRGLKVVPVARGKIAARRALHQAEQFLRQGWLFCMFPEGTRSRTPGMGHGHNGAALLALRTGAPILPIAVMGTHLVMPEGRFFPRRDRISLRIGKPLIVSRLSGRLDRQVLEELTERIMRNIAALLPQEYHGVYATEPAVAMAQQ